jgi:hypothetical protein
MTSTSVSFSLRPEFEEPWALVKMLKSPTFSGLIRWVTACYVAELQVQHAEMAIHVEVAAPFKIASS